MGGYDNNCPILEKTADGTPVGRCMFYCPNGICPRHGDVSEELATLRKTGKCTPESFFKRRHNNIERKL